jgi:hypothetical protein
MRRRRAVGRDGRAPRVALSGTLDLWPCCQIASGLGFCVGISGWLRPHSRDDNLRNRVAGPPPVGGRDKTPHESRPGFGRAWRVLEAYALVTAGAAAVDELK